MKRFLVYCPPTSFKSSVSLLLLRITFGLGMLVGHGWGKLMSFSDKADSFADPLGIGSFTSLLLAVLAETVCAALVAAGFMTRVMLVPLIITMAVAAFIVHGSDPFSGKEMALLYLSAYLVLFIGGPGKYSVDHYLK